MKTSARATTPNADGASRCARIAVATSTSALPAKKETACQATPRTAARARPPPCPPPEGEGDLRPCPPPEGEGNLRPCPPPEGEGNLRPCPPPAGEGDLLPGAPIEGERDWWATRCRASPSQKPRPQPTCIARKAAGR